MKKPSLIKKLLFKLSLIIILTGCINNNHELKEYTYNSENYYLSCAFNSSGLLQDTMYFLNKRYEYNFKVFWNEGVAKSYHFKYFKDKDYVDLFPRYEEVDSNEFVIGGRYFDNKGNKYPNPFAADLLDFMEENIIFHFNRVDSTSIYVSALNIPPFEYRLGYPEMFSNKEEAPLGYSSLKVIDNTVVLVLFVNGLSVSKFEKKYTPTFGSEYIKLNTVQKDIRIEEITPQPKSN